MDIYDFLQKINNISEPPEEEIEGPVQCYRCAEMFESCLQPFNECIQKCENELNERINSLDEEVLLQIRSNITTNFSNNFLTEEFGATQEDLKSIQIDLLYRRNEFWFLFTYIVSIVAAMYGITKFFRLTYSRHCDKFVQQFYVGTCGTW